MYVYCVGVFLSRKMHRRSVEDVAFRVLAAGNVPDHRTIGIFASGTDGAARILDQVAAGRRAGRPPGRSRGRRRHQDQANASKQTQRRTPGREKRNCARGAPVAGSGRRRRCGRGRGVRRISKATSCRPNGNGGESRGPDPRGKKALEARAKARAAAGESTAKPDSKSQYNYESRVADHEGPRRIRAGLQRPSRRRQSQLVGQAVTQETDNKHQLDPMIATIAQQSGTTPTQLLADAGYCSDENLAAIADTGIDAYISTRKQKHGERRGPVRAARCRRPPRASTGWRESCSRSRRSGYARRKGRQTRDRADQPGAWLPILPVAGPHEGRAEWSLVCTTHNT